MYSELMEFLPEEEPEFVGQTVEVLIAKGLTTPTKVKNCPTSVLETLLPPGQFPLELVLINCYIQKLDEIGKKKDPMTMATESMAKEARNQRRRRQGRSDESSEANEKKPFKMVESLGVYGLQDVDLTHMMKMKEVKKHAKEAKDKSQESEPYFVGEDVLKFVPQWMSADKDTPKSSEELSYPKWVALWWSARLTQLAAQGFAELSTVKFTTMLNEFLNVNRLAIERKHPAVAVQYDKHLWNTVQQESESGKKGVNVNELLTKVNANDVDNLIRNTKSLMDKPSLQASLGPSSHSGSGWSGKGHPQATSNSWNGGKHGANKGGGKSHQANHQQPSTAWASDNFPKGKSGKGGKKGKKYN